MNLYSNGCCKGLSEIFIENSNLSSFINHNYIHEYFYELLQARI